MTPSENKLTKDYIRRINLALQYIDDHLDAQLSLASIAAVAHYSPFHFHRIFKAIIGEPLNAYVSRRRIEKTASILLHKKEVRIAELSLQYGFTSNSSFTRAFKNFYGIPPTQFRKENPNKFSKIHTIESKNRQENSHIEKYICNITNHLNWIKMNATIEIKEIPALNFAGITHIGIQGIENTFEHLIQWAKYKGLMDTSEAKLGRVFHDSFKITSPNKVRMSICIQTDQPFTREGEISAITIKKSKCIVGRFEIAPNDFEKSWSALFVWMNDNGYKKTEENPFEIYHNDFRTHPEHKFIVDLYIPIM